MEIPSSYKKTHWLLFNFLSRIVLGYGFILVSCILLVLTLLGQTVDRSLFYIVMLLVVAIIGILLIRSKPYYPKKYKEYYKSIGKI